MITVYSRAADCLVATPLGPGDPLPDHTVWIDLHAPTGDEDHHIEALTGISVPTREEMREIEESSRFYSESNAHYLVAPVIHGGGAGEFGLDPIVFVLSDKLLATVRYAEPTPFRLFAARCTKPGSGALSPDADGLSVMLELLETIIDRIADHLENVAVRLDAESHRLFGNPAAATLAKQKPLTNDEFKKTLRLIAYEGEFLSKVRESLAGVSRFVVFAQSNVPAAKKRPDVRATLASVDRDLASLVAHASYLAERVTFLIDAVVGLVSVEQNAIIKLFSVAAVALMPPTLVASIYGMNFHFMPELDWPLGYPMAIGLMIVSAVLPLLYFKRRGWL